jgi:hypothetical protein
MRQPSQPPRLRTGSYRLAKPIQASCRHPPPLLSAQRRALPTIPFVLLSTPDALSLPRRGQSRDGR